MQTERALTKYFTFINKWAEHFFFFFKNSASNFYLVATNSHLPSFYKLLSD